MQVADICKARKNNEWPLNLQNIPKIAFKLLEEYLIANIVVKVTGNQEKYCFIEVME